MHSRKLGPMLVLAGGLGLPAPPGGSAAAAQSMTPKPPPGYKLVNSATIVAQSGTQVPGSVSCPQGLVPLGGSASIHSLNVHATVSSSFPVQNGWAAFVNNTS